MPAESALVPRTIAEEAYGFIHTGCFGGTLTICIWRAHGDVGLLALREMGRLWMKPLDRVDKELTEADWTKLKQLLRQANFWALPTSHELLGLDGFFWTIEGREGARYHASQAWCGGSAAFSELGNLFITLSGLKLPPNEL